MSLEIFPTPKKQSSLPEEFELHQAVANQLAKHPKLNKWQVANLAIASLSSTGELTKEEIIRAYDARQKMIEDSRYAEKRISTHKDD